MFRDGFRGCDRGAEGPGGKMCEFPKWEESDYFRVAGRRAGECHSGLTGIYPRYLV